VTDQESFAFSDRVTGRRVVQLTDSEAHSVHGYYDLPPRSPTTSQIAFTRMPSARAAEGDTYLMDGDGGNLTRVAHTRAVSANGGAMAQWAADGRRVYFTDREKDRSLIAWVDAASEGRGAYPGDLRMLSATAHFNVYHTHCGDYPDHEVVRQREEHGVYLQDLDTGASTRIDTVADCWRIHPRREEIVDWHRYIKHTKWSPDSARLMFVFSNEIRYAQKYAELPRVKDV
jgi:Tol biopolymer transport system component